MLSNDVDNHEENNLPFADCEIATDVYVEEFHPVKPESKSKKNHSRLRRQQQQKANHPKQHLQTPLSYLYFENSAEENNLLSFIPYSGPSNTSHLNRRLFLPQLISTTNSDSSISAKRFLQEYDQAVRVMTSSSTLPLSIYLRFGILYAIRTNSNVDQTISLREFLFLRHRGKGINTAFYTCKGVTSPKHLLTTITKLHYIPLSSNEYSYDIQLHTVKKSMNDVVHFQYDEQLRCTAVHSRPSHPINFDFLRDKTSSRFRSIDDSYSDIFDFRIQLSQHKFFDKTDPHVLDVLRGVPIDEVLYTDPSTHVLHIAPKLQKYVKYLKCTRSSNYQNLAEQLLISIGTYDEYQLNSNGQCESLMKASNTMTIEHLDRGKIPSGKKLYDIGIWFSNLCQTCVDLPTMIEKERRMKTKWFCDVLWKKSNRSIKQIDVNQLTIYRTNKSMKSYTNEELRLVKKILQEEDLRKIFIDSNEERHREEIYQNLTKRLKTSAVPSANEALEKVERAYLILSKEFL